MENKKITEYRIEDSPVFKWSVPILLGLFTLTAVGILIELVRIDNGVCLILRNTPIIASTAVKPRNLPCQYDVLYPTCAVDTVRQVLIRKR